MDQHITIGDIAPRIQYVADGTQASFTFPFPIFAAADMEVRLDGLVLTAGFIVNGAGQSDGGEVVFDTPPLAGRAITLRRHLAIARTTDFQENGILRARTLNDELDYQVAALQEIKEDFGGALHLDPSEVGGTTTLPLRDARANRLLGFDSLGDITVFDRGEGALTLAFPGAVPRTVEDKLAEHLSARDFGATGDGATDDGPALQAAMNGAAVSGKSLEIGEGVFRTSMALHLPGAAAGLTMRGTILYAGPAGQAALTLGDGGNTDNQRKRYLGLSVLRASQSDWSNEGDVGVRLQNINESQVEIRRAERFSIGVQIVGDARGSEDSDITYGRIVDNRIGLDLRTLTATAWMNSLRHYGGHFACSSGTNPGQDRFGIRLSAAPGAYRLHNAHMFFGPAFELQRQGTPGTVAAIPFLIDVDGRSLSAHGVRMEACSPFVARHTGGFSDARYEVAYVGTYAFTGCAVDYPGATRAGGTVIPLHQAAAAIGSPRLVAGIQDIRSAAFRYNATSVGIEGLAILSSNPLPAPTTLNGFAFGGLDSIGLNADSVQLPTSRALGFVVDCGTCKEFFLAAEGDNLRLVVMQFDAGESILLGSAPVLFSNMNSVWIPAQNWWDGAANLDNLSGGIALNKLQRVTLSGSAKYAVIGVRGGDSYTAANNLVRALRLYTGGTDAPRVLSGGSRVWGKREYFASATWDPPSVAAGGTATTNISVPGVVPGDAVSVGFSQSTTLPLIGSVSTADTVTVRLNNPTGAAVDLGSNTVFVTATKPKL